MKMMSTLLPGPSPRAGEEKQLTIPAKMPTSEELAPCFPALSAVLRRVTERRMGGRNDVIFPAPL